MALADEWLPLAWELAQRGEPFALATVVRCERPASARPGARALIRQDGSIRGWIGGSCAEPVAIREALGAIVDGQPRLLLLVGEGGARLERAEGVREYAMTCHSGGTLEIYVEPVLPKPQLVLVGGGPVVETLARLGAAVGLGVTLVEADPAAGARLPDHRVVDDLTRAAITPSSAIVVATHGRFDEDALAQALASEAGYVSLVASPKRAAAVGEALAARGVPPERLRRLKAPAGLDLGAVTPEEIAVSILAEIIQARRRASPRPQEDTAAERPRADARDPVCGMVVAIATARHRSEAASGVVYFCCGGCKRTFDLDPARYTLGARA